MTRLDGLVTEIGKELDSLLTSEDNKKAIDEYEATVEELRKILPVLGEAVERRQALSSSADDFQFEGTADAERLPLKRLVESSMKVQQTWEEDRFKIRQSGAIGRLRKAVCSYSELLEENSHEQWQDWRTTVEAQFGIAVGQLESIKHVLDFRDHVLRYQKRKVEFRSESRELPRTPATLKALLAIVQELTSIKGLLTFDLPGPVTKFYETLEREGSYPFGEISPEVGQWLADNDGLRDLVIVRRATVRE